MQNEDERQKSVKRQVDDKLDFVLEQIEQRTEAAKRLTEKEAERLAELVALRGDIQSLGVLVGEATYASVNLRERVAELEQVIRRIDADIRFQLTETRKTLKDLGDLLAKFHSGWTEAADQARDAEIEVDKPPGYELGERSDS